mgnify:CR=1 FL=1
MPESTGYRPHERRQERTAHTPGPWTYYIAAHSRLRAATGVGAGDYGAICTTGNHRPNERENEANARLIAAAPELLAGCRNLLDGLDAGTFRPMVLDDEEHGGWRVGNLDSMRALLAKIDGEVPHV